MEKIIGLLKVKIVRGVNLARRDVTGADPYVLVTMGDQKLKTSAKDNCLNPEWNEELTFAVSEPIKPIKFVVFDKDRLSKDDEMGNAEISIQPIFDVSMKDLIDVPYGVPILKLQPTKDNCLVHESPIKLEGRGKLVQHMAIRLNNVECGELEVELRWVAVPASGGSQK